MLVLCDEGDDRGGRKGAMFSSARMLRLSEGSRSLSLCDIMRNGRKGIDETMRDCHASMMAPHTSVWTADRDEYAGELAVMLWIAAVSTTSRLRRMEMLSDCGEAKDFQGHEF